MTAPMHGIADCLALPSDSAETWGLVVNEALAAGVPCVVSDAVFRQATGFAPSVSVRDTLSSTAAGTRSEPT